MAKLSERQCGVLAVKIARDLFALGSEPNDTAQRIEFKGGTYPDAETALGGLGEIAMARFLEAALKKHGTGA